MTISPAVSLTLAFFKHQLLLYYVDFCIIEIMSPLIQFGSITDVAVNEGSENGGKLPVLQIATALAVSFAICKVSTFLAKYFGIQGGNLPIITAIVVILATVFPHQFSHLAPAGEAMALILMQVSQFYWTNLPFFQSTRPDLILRKKFLSLFCTL